MRRFTIFISHSHKYGNQYVDLLKELRATPGVSFRNKSISAKRPLPSMTNGKLKVRINGRLKQCDGAIFIGGLFAVEREWIMYEWWAANRWRLPRIVVRQRTQPHIPDELFHDADYVVGWSGQEVANALTHWRTLK